MRITSVFLLEGVERAGRSLFAARVVALRADPEGRAAGALGEACSALDIARVDARSGRAAEAGARLRNIVRLLLFAQHHAQGDAAAELARALEQVTEALEATTHPPSRPLRRSA